LVAAVLGARPLIVEITSVAAIVLLMTYLIMPTVTRLLNPILLPSTKT